MTSLWRSASQEGNTVPISVSDHFGDGDDSQSQPNNPKKASLKWTFCFRCGQVFLHSGLVIGFLLLATWAWNVMCAPDVFVWYFAFTMLNVGQLLYIMYQVNSVPNQNTFVNRRFQFLAPTHRDFINYSPKKRAFALCAEKSMKNPKMPDSCPGNLPH